MPSQLFSPGTVVTSTWLNEADISTHPQLSTIGGTANVITATGPVSLLSYVTGQTFRFIPALTNTTAATININGLGVKAITKYGPSALVAGDLLAGMIAEIVYDGTNFQLSNPRTVSTNVTGRLINVQTFTASGTYTPTVGTTSIVVELVGGGGGGGGSLASAAGQVSIGSGGGGGGYGKTLLTSGFSGTSVTIGAGGAGSVGAAGVTGGVSSFGAFLSTPAASGGSAGSVGATSFASSGIGGASSGGTIQNINGGASSSVVASFSMGIVVGGQGAGGAFGEGGAGGISVGGSAAGLNSNVRGSGGGGAATINGAAAAGGLGSAGICIVYEYS